ncbi:hypothetical protein [Cryptosporangium aurantiacum]|uniref:Uncharacterized protein n=1 Tax=Cryptosporangium aurantiacum TaxID=134849 RepID=A0A1M7RM93_9ACTN|nr:hypothetical protein [Cryptosporangium aurantiacum]SHN47447.1 hypothetical protein SAMN05443668_1243 [Cryptosporangium aurantiacum]
MAAAQLRIFDLMACNVYWDFETPDPREQHKFLVAFYPTGGPPVHELIDTITAYGPNGYRVEIANQPFTPKNRNGHIYDRTTDSHWYMLNLATGFMEAGEYRIEVTPKDGGAPVVASRVQQAGPTEALVGAYENHRKEIYDSFTPGQGDVLDADAPRQGVDVRWSPLSTLSGQDAYYIFRLARGASIAEFDTQNLHWWDNIFIQRVTDPTAGLNRETVTVTAPLEPGAPYVYFTEITDSNAMGDTNICVFQPHQSFRA